MRAGQIPRIRRIRACIALVTIRRAVEVAVDPERGRGKTAFRLQVRVRVLLAPESVAFAARPPL